MRGGKRALNGVEFRFLVHKVQDVPAKGIGQAGPLQLVRLVDAVSVGEDHGQSPLAHMAHGGQRVGKNPLDKRGSS